MRAHRSTERSAAHAHASNARGASASPAPATVFDYLRAVYRRRWLAVSVLAIVVLSAAVYTFTAVPLYEARASILVEVNAPNVISFEEVLEEGSKLADYYQTQTELLRSRALAERTAASLRLWEHPSIEAKTEAGAASELAAGLEISPVRGTRLIQVKFRGPDAELAARIANAHARKYIEQNLEHRFVVSKEAATWLEGQLAEERKRVEQSESALQTFRERHDAVSLEDGQDIVVQKLADLNAAVTKAKTNRIESEAQYRELLAVQKDQKALDAFPAILSNSFIQRLKGELATLQREQAVLAETLGQRHPAILEKRSAIDTTEDRLAAEVTRIVESVRNAYRAALAEETSLMRALEEQKREALALNRRGIEYAALEREAESVRLVYQSLLQRAKETNVSRDLEATNIRIIDLAQRPGRPVFPRTSYNLIISVLFGGLLGIGVAFLVEFLDDRIKTPDDLTRQLGQTFLGLVPETRSKDRRNGPLLSDGTPASFAEAVRAIRTGILASAGGATSQSILIAGAKEGEGKTLVASNLAVALAQAQQRVLLVDADIRRPSVHDVFGLQLEPGLSNVLAGTTSLADVLRPSDIPGLTVVSAGTASREAPEILASTVFTRLFDIMQEHFTWVIVDAPPVLNVTDASVLASRVGGIVFVVGAGMTRARAARRAIEELERMGGRVLGVVLNRADLAHHPFYFSPYSRSDYGSASSDTAARAPQAAVLETRL
ncbi:MAG: GumC family protein [Vicinamibacterales bacterium]